MQRLENPTMAEAIHIAIHPKLIDLIDEKRGQVSRNEFIARIVAEKLRAPELGEIPRKASGRPTTRKRAS